MTDTSTTTPRKTQKTERRPVTPYFDLKKDPSGRRYMEVNLRGIALLRLVLTNKGTAFTQEERISLELDGLLPPQVETLADQAARVYDGFRAQPSDLAKYQFLREIQERQELLFYALLEAHLEEMLPIVYTPTVGKAVQQYSHIYQNPRGLSFSPINIHRAEGTVRSYPMGDVRMIVATDSSAILGIGDQGYGGLAIPIGKLALYTVAGGVSPFHTMPVALDVGTDRIDLINDPRYLGVRQRRLRGAEYDDFVDRFVTSIKHRWPKAVIQWEDLAKGAAFDVLERYRDVVPSFNDDIQGTGAVALAGVLQACALESERIQDHTFVIHGAGAGGVGVAAAIVDGLMQAGLSREEAHAKVFVLDSRGLLLEGRNMESYKAPFAQPKSRIADWKIERDTPDLLETVVSGGATVLLGLSGQPGAFDEAVVRAVAQNHARPIVFPLSNPTTSSEAHPAEVLAWTDGKARVATGSPFGDVRWEGKLVAIGQGNNAFIFPGLGMGAILSDARKITDGMVRAAAYALATYTRERYLDEGRIYPPVDDLQETSRRVAAAVLLAAVADGVAQKDGLPADETQALRYVEARFWKPEYLPFVGT
ncbi:MAG: NAD-dependent malic enzyme [Myxococcales bacterium]|nr:NAD-dependent malic enzyme [Myxococcales bacterium]